MINPKILKLFNNHFPEGMKCETLPVHMLKGLLVVYQNELYEIENAPFEYNIEGERYAECSRFEDGKMLFIYLKELTIHGTQ